MAKIIVSGAIANKCHNGGATWTRLNWVLGFRRLGCEVCFLEELPTRVDETAVHYFRDVIRQFGLEGAAALICNGGREIWGMSDQQIRCAASTADLLVNISGHLTWPPVVEACRRKAYVDLDPGFTQFWHADPDTPFGVGGHDSYFTIGENIGRPECTIPTAGIAWRPIRQPVVLDDWPVSDENGTRRFTTVANWRGPFGPVQAHGRTFGLKVHAFREYMELPRMSSQTFEIALNIDPADQKDLDALRDNGWRIVDPMQVAGSPQEFRAYIQDSAAEFSVAQGIYVDTKSGWFSDRSVRYLASGKPVLVQDTGFGRNLPVGEGLLAFGTLEEAVAGAEEIAADYPKHSRAARWIAEEFFGSEKILGRMLEEIGIAI